MSNPAVLPVNQDGFVRKQWTIQECRKMVANGIVEPGRYELIGGEILLKERQSRVHISIVTQIFGLLASIYGMESIQIRAQVGIGEIDPYNDPEPDVAVLSMPMSYFNDHEPNPRTEVLLSVEASATTLRGDIGKKAALYSQNGIREYWVVSIAVRELIVHRSPSDNGYLDVRTYLPDEFVAPLDRPDSEIAVSSLFV